MIINGQYFERLELDRLPDSWLLGDGIFETVRTYENRTFQLELHLDRLMRGASEMLGVVPVIDSISAAVAILLDHEPQPSGRLRILFGADGEWLVTHDEYRPPTAPAACVTVQTQFAATGIAKTTSYGPRFVALRKARTLGFDDAIFYADGMVAEATFCNVIALINGDWVTPNLAGRALPGITRSLLIKEFGVVERPIPLAELTAAESVALVSSLREIHPVGRIDSEVLPISNQLLALQSAFTAWVLGNLAS